MVGGAIVAFVSVVVAAVVALCAGGVIRRNAFVGIRVDALLESAEAWRDGHRRALPLVVLGAALCVVIAVVAALTRWAEPAPTLCAAAVMLVGVVAGTLRGSRPRPAAGESSRAPSATDLRPHPDRGADRPSVEPDARP